MKKIKSYTSIWNVEKVIYAINDFQLPFPITFNQMAWFVLSLFLIILFGELPPLSLIDGAFLKYFGIPAALTWFMSKKTFDGKKPFGFLKSVCTYAMQPKAIYAGKIHALQISTESSIRATQERSKKEITGRLRDIACTKLDEQTDALVEMIGDNQIDYRFFLGFKLLVNEQDVSLKSMKASAAVSVSDFLYEVNHKLMGDFLSMSNDEISRFLKMEKLLESKIARRFKIRRLESSFQNAIRLQFDCLVKRVVDTTGKDYQRELGRRETHEITFSDLSEIELNHFGTIDEYDSEFSCFEVMGTKVKVSNEQLADALKNLPEKKLNVLLMFYFLEMTDADGDVNATEKILKHYDAYISKASLRPLYDEYGNIYIAVDMELKGRIRAALMEMILKFELDIV